jgi:hypothetical protein
MLSNIEASAKFFLMSIYAAVNVIAYVSFQRHAKQEQITLS